MKNVPIGIRISQIKNLQCRIFSQLLKKNTDIDINTAQTNILFQLWNEDNITISELSNRTSLAKTTLTSMLDRMDSSGLIHRVTNEKNRRETRIVLTNLSNRMQELYLKTYQEMSQINFMGFSQKEQLELEHHLEHMYLNLLQYEEGNINNEK